MARLFARPPWPPAIVWVPALAVAAAVLLPPVYLFVRAASDGSSAADALFRLRILEILGRTLVLVIAVSVGSVILAVPLAWLTVRTDLPFRKFWAVLTALPLVIPSYVGGFIVVLVLGPRGMLQGLLENLFGVDRLPDINGFAGAMLTLTLLSYPYVLLTVRAGLLRLDPALEESSRGLGHNAWSTFFRVILRQLRPAIAGGALLAALYTLSDFGAVSLLRYETFTSAIFVQYGSALDRTLGAAMSLVLVALALSLVAGEAFTRGGARYYTTGTGVSRPISEVKLGRWLWPSLAFCGIVVSAALLLPMSILGYWVYRGVAAGEPLLFQWNTVRNSLTVSGLAAGATVAVALPVAVMSVRYLGLFSTVLERVTYIGFALPGISIALGLVFFGVNYAPPIYQTTGMLIFAYVVLFLSPAVGAARTSLLQVSPRMEEAARGLGSTPLRVFTSVTLPLVLPGILSGAALVFLLTMKELPATLILSPIGFTTLATSIWAAASEAFFARAAAPALLLILASSVPLGFLMLRERR
ncbi:MAG: iron ABC transporter permease [SAR202 cluster bacterium Io17-Chloro-G4]|nr:MAG: iron ABC transporter permease [SAR202 cluster bacterium Io17-Chloro-G4]